MRRLLRSRNVSLLVAGLGVILLLALGAGSVAETVESVETEEAGDVAFETALEMLEAAGPDARRSDQRVARGLGILADSARGGNARAAHWLGYVHHFGEYGVDPDFKTALEWYNTSANLGNAGAQSMVGYMLAAGHGVEEADPAQALVYWMFSALEGVPEALMALGYRYHRGIGVRESCEAASNYYRTAAQGVAQRAAATGLVEETRLMRLQDEALDDAPVAVRDDQRIVDYYRSLAEAGNVEAQVTVGQLHQQGGRGVALDQGEALRFYEMAAAEGHPLAMARLGQMHARGLGVPQSNATALRWYRKAADKNEPTALNGLGQMHLDGAGIEVDVEMARQYFKMAADRNNADAQLNLGNLYFAGIGGEVDYKRALHYFVLAGQQGHVVAIYNLALMHFNGLGTPKACATAVGLFKAVAESGHWVDILRQAEDMYRDGDDVRALIRYEIFAEQGYEVAQYNAAWLLHHGVSWRATSAVPAATAAGSKDAQQKGESGEDGAVSALDSILALVGEPSLQEGRTASAAHVSRADAAKALRLFGLSAGQGNVHARIHIGDYHYYGQGTDINFNVSAQHYRVAADHRESQALFNLGFMHQHGLGLPQDFHLAKRHYDSALAADSDSALAVYLALASLGGQFLYSTYDWQVGGLQVDTIVVAVLVAVLCGLIVCRDRVARGR